VLTRWWNRNASIEESTRVHRHLENAAAHLGPAWVEVVRQLGFREGPLGLGAPSRSVQRLPAPVSIDQVRWTVERELRQPFGHLFSAIYPIPIQIQDYSQVHRARLTWGGEQVRVRILHPGAAAAISRQLRQISVALRFLKVTNAGSKVNAAALIRDSAERLREDVDLRYQVRHMTLLRDGLFRRGIYIPWVYQQYSTSRLCVWEHVEGVSLQALLDFEQQDADLAARWSAWNRVIPSMAARRLLMALLNTVCGNGIFQEDITRSQIILLGEGRVCLDGPYRTLQFENEFRLNFVRRLQSLADDNISQFAESTLPLCDNGLMSSIDRAVDNITQRYRAWVQATSIESLTGAAATLAFIERQCAERARQSGFAPGLDWLRLLRTWSMLDQSFSYRLTGSQQLRLIKRVLKLRDSEAKLNGEGKDRKLALARLYTRLVTGFEEANAALRRSEIQDLVR
jgi:predicted unusual protein kinase regulating ubiquinone biosynthesis (AarF/ABC1/UbiB family)